MHAAVVERWGESPKFRTFDLPPPDESQVRVRVLAARVHENAYDRIHRRPAHATLPYIPGRDGVGLIVGTDDLVYFTGHLSPTGSIAEEMNIEKRDIFPLPQGADPDATALEVGVVAAPWMAIACRAGIQPGSDFSVGVLNAAQKGGHAAIRTAKAMGATSIVAIDDVGLDACCKIGATSTIDMGTKIRVTEAVDFGPAAEIDIMLDYGLDMRSSVALTNIMQQRQQKRRRLTWVKMDGVAVDQVRVPIGLLRSANLYICGSSPMAWSYLDFSRELPAILEIIARTGMHEEEEYSVQRLEDVEIWWKNPEIILAKPCHSNHVHYAK